MFYYLIRSIYILTTSHVLSSANLIVSYDILYI